MSLIMALKVAPQRVGLRHNGAHHAAAQYLLFRVAEILLGEFIKE